MITHENLVWAVYRINDAWSCPGMNGKCSTDYDCTECAERLVNEYENAIRADGRRKFAEWLQSNGYYVYVMSTPDGIYTEEVTVDEIISAYEKEQKEGEQT